MNSKLSIILSILVFLFALTLHDCDATGAINTNVAFRNGETTSIAFSIDEGAIDAPRYLSGEENIHIRKRADYFTLEFPYAILSGILIYFISFVLLLFLIPAITDQKSNFFKPILGLNNTNGPTNTHMTDIVAPSIASGAILATTLFLALPEAVLLIQRGTSENEGEIEIVPGTIWRCGLAILMGFILDLTMEALFPRKTVRVSTNEFAPLVPSKGADSKKQEEGLSFERDELESLKSDSEKQEEGLSFEPDEHESLKSPEAQTMHEPNTSDEARQTMDGSDADEKSSLGLNDSQNEYSNVVQQDQCLRVFYDSRRVILLLTNSTLKNVFDGFFIGAAFMTCSTAAAVCISIIVIYREISAKADDYLLLSRNNDGPTLLFIVGSGAAVLLGISIVIATKQSDLSIGIFLAIASGVFLHISTSICIPRAYSVAQSSRDRLYTVISLVIGALPICFTFLNHEHCYA